MMPVAPSLIVRPLQGAEREVVADAINSWIMRAPFSSPLTPDAFYEQLFSLQPPTLLPVRWQRLQRLCAWRARRLEGFIDVAVGLDSESQELPDYQPLGLLRFLLLAQEDEQDFDADVANALLDAAEEFWRKHGVAQVKAFHSSIGYPSFQAGMGALPGDWAAEIRALTGNGYHFSDRFYAMSRSLDEPVEEITPIADLSLVYDGTRTDRVYHLYKRADWIGHARVTEFDIETPNGMARIAKLVSLHVDPDWRNKHLGKWLVKRIINDCTLLGHRQLLAHVPHSRHAAISLFNLLGFIEQNYRGYTLEKILTE